MPPRMKVTMKRSREGEDAAAGVKQEPVDAEAKREEEPLRPWRRWRAG